MNTESITTWFKTVIVGRRVVLTDAQLAGDECALCGHRFFDTERPVSFGWIGLPLRRRAWACPVECTITAVEDVEALFRSAIPARQDVRFWHLGVDDVPLVTAQDGGDTVDEAYTAALAAQPHAPVEIVHGGGVLTTRPLPLKYAGYIAMQARKLGFTAMVRAEVSE